MVVKKTMCFKHHICIWFNVFVSQTLTTPAKVTIYLERTVRKPLEAFIALLTSDYTRQFPLIHRTKIQTWVAHGEKVRQKYTLA